MGGNLEHNSEVGPTTIEASTNGPFKSQAQSNSSDNHHLKKFTTSDAFSSAFNSPGTSCSGFRFDVDASCHCLAACSQARDNGPS
mmetsp:Transcript_4983/g.10323  ORF Transcript_4983/g.10323 Transcript_4983/m.10323 type:complete len:85 (-) Transcript_4983:2313-2567(-)